MQLSSLFLFLIKQNHYFAGTLAAPENTMTVKLGEHKLSFDVRGFFQSNLFVFEKVCRLITDILPGGENILDMYSGCGSISSFLTEKYKNVVLVDGTKACEEIGSPKVLNMIMLGAYGGGIQTGNTCGAVLAAASVLSMKYIEQKAHESKDIKPVTTEFIRRINGRYGSVLCKDIKPQSFDPEHRCRFTVEEACDILESVIADYEKEKA